jgi:hypothetical protein
MIRTFNDAGTEDVFNWFEDGPANAEIVDYH